MGARYLFDLEYMQLCEMAAVFVFHLHDLQLFVMGAVQLKQM